MSDLNGFHSNVLNNLLLFYRHVVYHLFKKLFYKPSSLFRYEFIATTDTV